MPNKPRNTPFRPAAPDSRRSRSGRPAIAATEAPETPEASGAQPAGKTRRPPRAAPVDPSKRARHREMPGKPERLHKLLAQSGIGSRREMEELIA
ncbi:MAG: hypothetical protein KAX55_18805, partial [Propionivibrio sp.]|nr:hypothetical protein [Propionivibrio sp.]